MPREIPRHVPKLVPTRVTTATTYHFKNAARDFGWALATVNDETGELNIQSDWGNWSYRWDARPSNLGAPTLTHFIAHKHTECDYLADKLWGGGYGGMRFSPEATVASFRRELAKLRLEEGRHHLMLSDYRSSVGAHIDRLDMGATSALARKRRYYDHQSWTGADGEPLTRGIAREIWDALDELQDVRDESLFLERLHRVHGHAWLGEDLWDQMQSEQAPMYQVLLYGILPALRDACALHLKSTPSPAPEGVHVAG